MAHLSVLRAPEGEFLGVSVRTKKKLIGFKMLSKTDKTDIVYLESIQIGLLKIFILRTFKIKSHLDNGWLLDSFPFTYKKSRNIH